MIEATYEIWQQFRNCNPVTGKLENQYEVLRRYPCQVEPTLVGRTSSFEDAMSLIREDNVHSGGLLVATVQAHGP